MAALICRAEVASKNRSPQSGQISVSTSGTEMPPGKDTDIVRRYTRREPQSGHVLIGLSLVCEGRTLRRDKDVVELFARFVRESPLRVDERSRVVEVLDDTFFVILARRARFG